MEYRLLIRKHKQKSNSVKILHEAKNDEDAIKLAKEYAEKHNAKLYSLEKEHVIKTNLLHFD